MKYLLFVVAGLLFAFAGYYFLQHSTAYGFEMRFEGLREGRFYLTMAILFVILSRISALHHREEDRVRRLVKRAMELGRKA